VLSCTPIRALESRPQSVLGSSAVTSAGGSAVGRKIKGENRKSSFRSLRPRAGNGKSLSNYEDMRRLVLVLAALSLSLGSSASAHDHRAPRASLRVAGQVQGGLQYHADGWARQSNEPGFCVVTFATGFPKFRKALTLEVGDETVVRLHKKAMPLELEVQRWPRVDKSGRAAGTPSPLPWTLRPHIVDGEVRAWEVTILAAATEGHVYLGVGAYWPDEDGCSQQPDLGSQYAAWTFHLVAN
jgi:hypothetical protein